MIDALYISASGLRGQQQQIDTISNNVANLQTPGFKKSRLSYIDLAQLQGPIGAEAGSLRSLGAGTRVASSLPDLTAGDVRLTRNAMDIAINGAGFFELQDTDGSLRYSRAGQFKIDSDGFIASMSGRRLAAGIQLPPDASDIRIEPNGEVTAILGHDGEVSSMGFIDLALFPSADALTSLGDNLFALTDPDRSPLIARPGEQGMGTLQQGVLELSNVDMVDEMTSLVLAQRAYQLNARVLQASDQVLETINNLRR
jgi:flagellar basal-body rod protein FlgG